MTKGAKTPGSRSYEGTRLLRAPDGESNNIFASKKVSDWSIAQTHVLCTFSQLGHTHFMNRPIKLPPSESTFPGDPSKHARRNHMAKTGMGQLITNQSTPTKQNLVLFNQKPTQDAPKEFYVSFFNLPLVERVRQLKTNRIGRLVSVSGTVTRSTDVRPELLRGTFSCRKCGLVREAMAEAGESRTYRDRGFRLAPTGKRADRKAEITD